MQKLIFAIIGGTATYMLINFVVSLVTINPRSILFLLCPFAAAVVADLWHAKAAPVLSVPHLVAVFSPTVIMFVFQSALVLVTGRELGGVGYYAAACGIALVVSVLGFAITAFVRSTVLGYAYDEDEAELASYGSRRQYS